MPRCSQVLISVNIEVARGTGQLFMVTVQLGAASIAPDLWLTKISSNKAKKNLVLFINCAVGI